MINRYGLGALQEKPEVLAASNSVARAISNVMNPLPVEPAGYLNFIPVTRDQSYSGECVGFSSHYSVETQMRILFGDCPELSPDYIYRQCKLIDGSPKTSGTYVTTAAQILQKYGTVREVDDPFFPSNELVPLPSTIGAETEYRISSYTAESYNEQAFNNAFPLFGPPIITTAVTEDMFSPTNNVTDYNTTNTYIYGYHALAIIASDPIKRQYTALNSWGSTFGNSGLFQITYDYADHYFSSFVTMTPDVSQKIVGDENADDVVNVRDAIIALNVVVSRKIIIPSVMPLFDMNRDGKTDVKDVIAILRKAAGLS